MHWWSDSLRPGVELVEVVLHCIVVWMSRLVVIKVGKHLKFSPVTVL